MTKFSSSTKRGKKKEKKILGSKQGGHEEKSGRGKELEDIHKKEE